MRSTQILADIRKSILEKFRNAGIVIPYPVRTLDIPKEFFTKQNKDVS
jgi:small-conductance mechanosensitive channel